MMWLNKFKEMLDNNPDMTDGELYRAFPELKSSPDRLTAALMYWRYEVVAKEFIIPNKPSRWQRFKNFLWQK